MSLPTPTQTQEVQRQIYERQQVADDNAQEQERVMLERLQYYMQPGGEVEPAGQQQQQFGTEYHQYQRGGDTFFEQSNQQGASQAPVRNRGMQGILPKIVNVNGGGGDASQQQHQQQRSRQTNQQDLLMQSSTGPIQTLKTPQYQNHPYAQQQHQQQQDYYPQAQPAYGVPEVSVPRLVSGAPKSIMGGDDSQGYDYNGGSVTGNRIDQPAFTKSPHSHAFDSSCNILAGGWRFSKHRHSWYSGSSCPYIRPGFNCQLNGRNDTKFLQYYWQPHGCNLPQFNPKDFLNRYRNKVSCAHSFVKQAKRNDPMRMLNQFH